MMEMRLMFVMVILFLPLWNHGSSRADEFIFNGFSSANLSLNGIASVTRDGILQMTNTTQNMEGHAFYPAPLRFRSAAGKALSFSFTFVFGILSDISDLSGGGLALVISPSLNFYTDALAPSQYFGVFTRENNGNAGNHIFAIELDTLKNPEFDDINDNHVGIDINGLNSSKSYPAGYYDDSNGSFKNLTLISGQPMQAWVDYDGEGMQLNVTLCSMQMSKPRRPLLSYTVNLSSLMRDYMYVGFSSANGPFHTYHDVLGWSFKMNGEAQPLDYLKLPALPRPNVKGHSTSMPIWLLVVLCLIVVLAVSPVWILVRRRRMKYAELLEDWEVEYGPHRFKYRDLFRATEGFKDKGLLGTGGFGRVYHGLFRSSGLEVAVKRVSHDSRQGMREFVAEIVSIGQIRHRNLAQLLGYCRRKGELLLVYDFMPNGSLDKYLYDCTKPTLSWAQRFGIIRGVAAGLLYLHEDCEHVVVHRDIKASNVLLDGEFNGRLGDFGLAKLYDHGTDPQTTHVVGTMGYIAPELAMNGKATTVTDVFAFGAFVLEVVCGRRPIEPHAEGEELVLVDWVVESWRQGMLMDTIDTRLGGDYCATEVELVLKVGLLCSHPLPSARPNMRQVVQILDGEAMLPTLPDSLSFSPLELYQNLGFDSYIMSVASSAATLSSVSLSAGR